MSGVAEAVTEALRTSRLMWGTHADRWNDRQWQDEFWGEAGRRAAAALQPYLDAEVSRRVDAEKATAWDEGWAAGADDQMYGSPTPNPYREARRPAPEDGEG